MKITASIFDSNAHESQEAGNDLHGRYTLHNIDVYNEITIDGESFQAVYQAGVGFLYNDYNCPDPSLRLSEEGGADYVLCAIDSMYEQDFEDQELINDILLGLSKDCNCIKTAEQLYQVWDFLRNQQPDLNDFI